MSPDTSNAPDEAALPPRRNIKLVIAYNGARYHGWQRQAGGIDTIQERVEQAAMRVLGHPVVVFGASRTDTGVHAAGQVASFYTTNLTIPLINCRRAIDAKLPADISVRSAEQVSDAFHASRSAIGKTYRYRIHTSPERPVMIAEQVWRFPWTSLDVAAMRQAGRRLIGRHDFAGFAGAADERESTVRRIRRCDVAEVAPEVRITVAGDGFLYHMVRNIAGTLLEIGRGRWPADRIDRILATCDRALAGATAPAGGLTLMAVHYR